MPGCVGGIDVAAGMLSLLVALDQTLLEAVATAEAVSCETVSEPTPMDDEPSVAEVLVASLLPVVLESVAEFCAAELEAMVALAAPMFPKAALIDVPPTLEEAKGEAKVVDTKAVSRTSRSDMMGRNDGTRCRNNMFKVMVFGSSLEWFAMPSYTFNIRCLARAPAWKGMMLRCG